MAAWTVVGFGKDVLFSAAGSFSLGAKAFAKTPSERLAQVEVPPLASRLFRGQFACAVDVAVSKGKPRRANSVYLVLARRRFELRNYDPRHRNEGG